MGSVKGLLGTVRSELEGKLPEISTGIGDVEDSLENLTMELARPLTRMECPSQSMMSPLIS